jgi:hypothetical protein
MREVKNAYNFLLENLTMKHHLGDLDADEAIRQTGYEGDKK